MPLRERSKTSSSDQLLCHLRGPNAGHGHGISEVIIKSGSQIVDKLVDNNVSSFLLLCVYTRIVQNQNKPWTRMVQNSR